MKTLSIIMPAYNEVATVERALERLLAVPFALQREVVLVDDGSTDGTGALLETLSARHGLRLLRHPHNRGKGAALAWGISCATGDIIAIQDADLEYDPADLPTLIAPLLREEADAVYGSRFAGPGFSGGALQEAGNRVLTGISNCLSGIRLTDMETCYKVFRADLLRSMVLRSHRFGVEVEITAYLGKARARVVELPISYTPRGYRQGKKIGWVDGVAALFHLVRFNLLVSRQGAFRDPPMDLVRG